MDGIFYAVLIVAIASAFLLFYLFIRSKGGKIVQKFRGLYGEDLVLITGCGMITSLSREPGVLGLLRDRVIFQSTITGKSGEIPFQDVGGIVLEDTRHTKHRRARKYRNAKVLEINTTRGGVSLFAIPLSQATVWEEALNDFIKRKEMD